MAKIKVKRKQRVILLNSVRGLGKRLDVVEVKNGYFRNYLAPFQLALRFSEEKLTELQNQLTTSVINIPQSLKDQLENTTLRFKKEANTLGVLYSSVTKDEIISYLNGYLPDVKINKRYINFNKSVKTVGDYTVEIQLGEDFVTLKLTVENIYTVKKEQVIPPVEPVASLDKNEVL